MDAKITIQTLEVDWKKDRGGKKTWLMRATGFITNQTFTTSFEVTKAHDRSSRLKLYEARLFQVDMDKDTRLALAKEIKAYAEKSMDEQLRIIVMSRPSL